MAKIKLENELYDRVSRFADIAGYSSAEEFVTHVLEKELSSIDDSESEEEVKKRLQGLGYLS
jgi:metal-responsive CopG/Arc/MetJ family transcriptional regulator